MKKKQYKAYCALSQRAQYWLQTEQETFDKQSLLNALQDGRYISGTDLTQEDCEQLTEYLEKYDTGERK